MTEMYKGIPFSPQATLTDNIGAADTIIPVSDVSAFPDGPNFATIGTDADGETIFYATKTASALSGCTRGVEGAAKGWQSGEVIARNFNSKDLEALQENIKALDQTAKDLAEKIGQVFVVGDKEPNGGPVLWFDTRDRGGGAAV